MKNTLQSATLQLMIEGRLNMQQQQSQKRDRRIPAELTKWLYASGSLTQQLTDLAQGIFKVEPNAEHFQRLSLADAQWMQMPAHHTAWVRESHLYGCEAKP